MNRCTLQKIFIHSYFTLTCSVVFSMPSKQEELRARVVQFFQANEDRGKKYTVDHFCRENVPVSTVYRILACMRVTRKRGCGRPAKIMNEKTLRSLRNMFNNKDSVSQREAARKFHCSKSLIGKTLKKEGIVCRKKTRSPEYTDEQIQTVKSQCRWMTRNYSGKSFVLDDESYFPLSKSQIPGNDRFYTKDKSTTPPKVMYKFKHKFESKVMLYIVISDKGISKPWFKPSGLAINQEVYQRECLQKILIPFLKQHHSDGKYVFWPDKASSHYAKKTLTFLESQNIPYVPKDRNPTNLPQCRPIEDFFGLLSSMVYKDNWKAKNTKQLTNRIKSCIRKIDVAAVQRSCSSITTKLRRTADHGPYANIH